MGVFNNPPLEIQSCKQHKCKTHATRRFFFVFLYVEAEVWELIG
jgi:hypothetical protein